MMKVITIMLRLHNMVTYGAKYYSYLWAQVFAVDIFEHLKMYGLFTKEVDKK